MKELSIEEKAKAYDEVLERAKDYQKVNGAAGSAVISEIFPELVENESKDEQLRKNCIHFLELQKSHHAATFEIEECIDWLEKQKEPEDKGEISDGYHTFNELYRYRMLYNAAFFNLLPKDIVHKSKRHHDGEECFGGGWFIVMANLPTGQISNHYELKDWDLFQIPEQEVADEWDGHTPQEAADRLHEYLLKKQNKYEWVDLGLPSGTKWATCNIGATKPEECGGYFAWGEVKPKKYYYWSTYKYGTDGDNIIKYCDDSTFGKKGFTDGKYNLEPDDDAAYVNLGSKWHTPTKEQQDELINHCYWVWTDNYNNSNVRGYIVYKAQNEVDMGVRVFKNLSPIPSYSLSDAHIFLPAAGLRVDDNLLYVGSDGYYWASEHTDYMGHAVQVRFDPDFVGIPSIYRCYGCTIRPVLNQDL